MPAVLRTPYSSPMSALLPVPQRAERRHLLVVTMPPLLQEQAAAWVRFLFSLSFYHLVHCRGLPPSPKMDRVLAHNHPIMDNTAIAQCRIIRPSERGRNWQRLGAETQSRRRIADRE